MDSSERARANPVIPMNFASIGSQVASATPPLATLGTVDSVGLTAIGLANGPSTSPIRQLQTNLINYIQWLDQIQNDSGNLLFWSTILKILNAVTFPAENLRELQINVFIRCLQWVGKGCMGNESLANHLFRSLAWQLLSGPNTWERNWKRQEARPFLVQVLSHAYFHRCPYALSISLRDIPVSPPGAYSERKLILETVKELLQTKPTPNHLLCYTIVARGIEDREDLLQLLRELNLPTFPLSLPVTWELFKRINPDAVPSELIQDVIGLFFQLRSLSNVPQDASIDPSEAAFLVNILNLCLRKERKGRFHFDVLKPAVACSNFDQFWPHLAPLILSFMNNMCDGKAAFSKLTGFLNFVATRHPALSLPPQSCQPLALLARRALSERDGELLFTCMHFLPQETLYKVIRDYLPSDQNAFAILYGLVDRCLNTQRFVEVFSLLAEFPDLMSRDGSA